MSRSEETAALMDALAATWPAAETRDFGGWAARRGLGGGKRVSALIAAEGAGLDGDFDAACAQSKSWEQPVLAQIAPGRDDLDAALAARGWALADPTVLMAAPLEDVAAVEEAGRIVARVRTPLAALEDLWAAGEIGPARRAVMARAPEPKERFLIRERERPGAAVFVAVSGDIAMLHALHVAPAFRRSGVGRAAVHAVARWAREQGAARLGLAVTEANAAAIALYDGMGLRRCGAYHYRCAPAR